MDFKSRKFMTVRRGTVGPQELSARSQLAATSLICKDFMNLHAISQGSMDFKGRKLTDGHDGHWGP